MAWCHQATSHYLSQCWPRLLSSYDVTRPQWVKLLNKQPWCPILAMMVRCPCNVMFRIRMSPVQWQSITKITQKQSQSIVNYTSVNVIFNWNSDERKILIGKCIWVCHLALAARINHRNPVSVPFQSKSGTLHLLLNTLRPRQNGYHFTDNISVAFFFQWKCLNFYSNCIEVCFRGYNWQ